MRRLIKISLAFVALVIGLPILCLVLVLACANTGVGRQWIEYAVSRFTDGKVMIDNLSGRFPDRLRIGRIVVGDAGGAWLTINQARIDWSPLRIIDGEVKVETLTAAHVAIARLPESSASEPARSLP